MYERPALLGQLAGVAVDSQDDAAIPVDADLRDVDRELFDVLGLDDDLVVEDEPPRGPGPRGIRPDSLNPQPAVLGVGKRVDPESLAVFPVGGVVSATQ